MKTSLFRLVACLFGCSFLAVGPAANAAPPAAGGSDQSAQQVVQRYYAALDHGHYKAAYGLWCDHGSASGKSLADFTAGFADTAHTSVATDKPTDPEGAAGSVYITVPARVTATRKDGTQQRYAGQYVLRRCNDVEGCTPEDRRWHIFSATLHAAK